MVIRCIQTRQAGRYRDFSLLLPVLLILVVMQTIPSDCVSAETGSSKDLELLQAGMAATAGAVTSAPSSTPAAAPEIVAENLAGEKFAGPGGDTEEEDEEDTAGQNIITCKTKISLVQVLGGKPIIVDQFSTVMFTGPLPIKEAFDRVIKLAEKDLDPEKVVEISFTCEFP